MTEARIKVLLAEDVKVNQLVAVTMLEERGHSVSVAENGRQGLALLEKEDCVTMQTFHLKQSKEKQLEVF